MTNFTKEDLVQYLYRETSENKTVAIAAALETDWDLRDSFQEFATGKKNLEEVNLSPRSEAVNKIIQHISKSHAELSAH